MDFKNFTSKELHNGIQYLNFWPNGYGVSIVRHDFSRTKKNTWEIAILQGTKENWDICYSTPITDDVLSNMTDDEVNKICEQVSKL